MQTGLAVKPSAVLLVVGTGTLFSAMAGSAVNLALPALGRELSLTLEASRWVIQAFLLTTGALLLPAGRLGDVLGHRRIYLLGYSLFGLASFSCGLVSQFWLLVVLRILQAVGGAMALATGPALLTLSFPVGQRGRALGIQATATYIGLTVGPPLGGFLVSALGWRWTFFIFAPASLLVLLFGCRLLPRSRAGSLKEFDWAGAASLVAGIPGLLFAVSEIHRRGAADPWIWLALLAAAAGIFWYTLHGRKSERPVLDLSLFARRGFSAAAASAVANYIALFTVTILLPFFLEEGRGKAAATAGLLLSVQPLMMALVASPAGWLSDRLGSRGLATGGMFVLAVAIGGLALRLPSLGGAELVLWLGGIGVGTGTFISPNSNTLMGTAPLKQQGSAGAVLAEARVLGMFLGVALASAIFSSAGGKTGASWGEESFFAMRAALLAGALCAAAGAAASAMRGGRHSHVPSP